MFRTIHDCRLELVASTQLTPSTSFDPEYGDCYDVGDSDTLPVSAARASFGKEDKTGEDPDKDLKLMKYLAEHQHLTPFEYQHATFLVECPLFIRSQIHRHRTFSYNEISRRYTDENIEFWIPDKWRKQSKSNKQASADEELVFPHKQGYGLQNAATMHIPPPSYLPLREKTEREHCRGVNGRALREVYLEAFHMYEGMIEAGICREQARAVLPQSLLTRFYMGGNLRNWAHFIKLRKDSHAQYEVQVIAGRIEEKLRALWPASVGALLDES